jgi:hypothetical protein
MKRNIRMPLSKLWLIGTTLILAFGILAGSTQAHAANAPLTPTEKATLKAADWTAIYNLMSRHAWYHSAFMNDVELDKLWVKKTPNPIWAQNYQQWVGWDAIKKSYGLPSTAKDRAGSIQFHTVSTPVIEIAEDRKTAMGVFYTAGVVGSYQKDGTANTRWMWERYGMECVLEDGEWKIWHLHVYSDFAADFGKQLGSPADMPGIPGSRSMPDAKAASSGAERFGQENQNNANAGKIIASANAQSDGYLEFGPTSSAILMPRSPEPYKTYADTWHYVDLDERAKATEYTNNHK